MQSRIEIFPCSNGWIMHHYTWNGEEKSWDNDESTVYQDQDVLVEAIKDLLSISKGV